MPWLGPGGRRAKVHNCNFSVGSRHDPRRRPSLLAPVKSQDLTCSVRPYDDDGNLTGDGAWNYTYDAENRLTVVETPSTSRGASLIPNASARRLEFQYDSAGRRVSKVSYKNWNGSTYTELVTAARFLYDGWNLVAEFSSSDLQSFSLSRSYTWGLDLAGSLTATGGVGALLQIHDYAGGGKTLLATYDGNGNLAALLNASTGDTEAAYEYDPFGNLLRAEGAYAKSNPIRFSSKFTDDETGLVYYGHRYYSPGLGRFINRDPIGETGGLNLYGFCGNDGVNGTDYLGMTEADNRGRYGGIVFNFDGVWEGPGPGFYQGRRTRPPHIRSQWKIPSLESTLGRSEGPYSAKRFIFAANSMPSVTGDAPLYPDTPLSAYSLPIPEESAFSGPGYMDAFGQTHPTFCLSCHDTTVQAGFYKDQASLANDQDIKIFFYQEGLTFVLTLPAALLTEEAAIILSTTRRLGNRSVRSAEALANARRLGGRGVRNLEALTEAQRAEIIAAARDLGLDPSDIKFISGPTAYLDAPFDVIVIGPNAIAAPGRAATLLERMTPRTVVAHEAGHLLTSRAGTSFPAGSVLDEVQASLVGRTLPGLTRAERMQLLRDAVERARAAGANPRDLLRQLKQNKK